MFSFALRAALTLERRAAPLAKIYLLMESWRVSGGYFWVTWMISSWPGEELGAGLPVFDCERIEERQPACCQECSRSKGFFVY